ncbi:MAG: DUF4430 domain-containing protein [Patescibacteria group bacterium]
MRSQKLWLIGGALVLAAIAGAVFVFQSPITAPDAKTTNEATIQATVSIGIENLYEHETLSVPPGTTILEALEILDAKDPALGLEIKEYSGLGTLITSMGGMRNGNGDEYWQYRVNGVMPLVGADAYELRTGDAVEWIFEASQQ